mmetsp:Transcript_21440/g.39367  ORF Transcript_21440/g.39367 Transcript_21440/m.39367 type:complete len:191 (+) Transcript_21440:725-1297(+)
MLTTGREQVMQVALFQMQQAMKKMTNLGTFNIFITSSPYAVMLHAPGQWLELEGSVKRIPQSSICPGLKNPWPRNYQRETRIPYPIPVFLHELTKMLTDGNRDIIKWCANGIAVYHPDRLEKEVLGRYFNSSKYSSFQKQMNNYNFRKIAGERKMSPCSFVHDNLTTDIGSLLSIKRKTFNRKNSQEKDD